MLVRQSETGAVRHHIPAQIEMPTAWRKRFCTIEPSSYCCEGSFGTLAIAAASRAFAFSDIRFLP